MKKIYILVLLSLLCTNICRADNSQKVLLDGKELTVNEFPIIEGSPSTESLRFILACKLLGFNYKWYSYSYHPNISDANKKVDFYTSGSFYPISRGQLTDEENYFYSLHQSHFFGSIKQNINLIDNNIELLILDQDMSIEDKEYAAEKGVMLLSKPIARDALTFMINCENPITNLSTQQIQGIYTGDITNWNEVGGNDENIVAYVRDTYSCEQKEFETKVMGDKSISSFPILDIIAHEASPYRQIIYDKKAISYTPFYYHNVITGPSSTKAVGVDGVDMTRDNIINGTYPYINNIYAFVRSDIDKSSVAYKIYEFLTTDEGQSIVDESGYVPLQKASNISSVSKLAADIEMRDHTINVVSDEPVQRIEVADLQGRIVFQKTTNSNSISVPSDMHGIYMVSVWFAGEERLTKKINMR